MGTPGAATAEVVDLQAIGLPRLVFALLRQRFSGLLSVPQAEPDAGERSVWFQGGMPIFTDWVSASDSLGQILVETGQLTPEERDRATLALQSPGPEAAASPRERLGHYLVRRRLLTTAQLRKALRIQCARKLVHAFAVRSGEAHVTGVAARYPRTSGRLRIALLHDPTAFRFLPPGAADLVLSGHMHGGQLGLLSLGGAWTVPRLFDVPDHGLWARGRNRMYLHRGTGHYGFPVRLGVPSEEGVIHVHWKRARAP